MAERLKMKQLQDDMWGYFSWGIIGWKGIHITPLRYSVDSRNTRVVNGSLTNRDGFYTLSADPEGLGAKKIRGMTSNTNLYVVADKKFYTVDTDTGAWTEQSSIGNRFTNDVDINFVNFGKYTICLSGDDYPWVYNRVADTWTKLTAANIEATALPRFWAKFAYGTYLAGNSTKKDILYISRGATSVNPEYSFDYVWAGSELKQMQSNIESVVANKERLFIFTEESIEIITTQSLASTGGITSTYSIPIAGKNRVAAHRGVVVADDIIFFRTKKNQIKTISYIPGVTEASIGTLTSRKWFDLDNYMSLLDSDQSEIYGYYHKEKQLVIRHVRGEGETINTETLVYDIANDNFYPWDNKYFSCGTEHNDEYYTGDCSTAYIYIDEKGSDDDSWPISWYRNWAYWCPWLTNVRYEYREVGLSGQIGTNTTINVSVLVDDIIEKEDSIVGADEFVSGVASWAIAEDAIAADYAENNLLKFEKVISPGNLRARGKMIQVNVSGSGVMQDFALSGCSIGYLPLGNTDTEDKL